MFSASWTPLFIVLGVLSLLWKQRLLFMANVSVLAISLAAYSWGKISLKRVSYNKEIHPLRTFPGEPATLTITLENHKLLPITWLQMEEDVPEDLILKGGRLGIHYIPGRKRLLSFVSLGYYERVRRQYEIRFPRRGYYSLGPARLTCGDPFGFCKETLALKDTTHLIVYPRILPLEALGLPARRPLGDTRVSDRLLQDPSFVAGIRDYDPSDSFKRIHWKATARTGSLQVKVYEPRAETCTAVFLNAATYDPPWLGLDVDLLDQAITVAASVFSLCLENRYVAGIFSNGCVAGTGTGLKIPPSRSPEMLEEGLAALAKMHGPSGSICTLLDSEVPGLPPGCGVVLVTGFTNEELRDSILAARDTGRQVIVLLVGQNAHLDQCPGVTVRRVHLDGGAPLELQIG
ncbi:MAG: DUF58 domain-containing protein [Firmicutes bacterium]|nr:DUF58 domain-containing protein [Bacillota bacterium]